MFNKLISHCMFKKWFEQGRIYIFAEKILKSQTAQNVPIRKHKKNQFVHETSTTNMDTNLVTKIWAKNY